LNKSNYLTYILLFKLNNLVVDGIIFFVLTNYYIIIYYIIL